MSYSHGEDNFKKSSFSNHTGIIIKLSIRNRVWKVVNQWGDANGKIVLNESNVWRTSPLCFNPEHAHRALFAAPVGSLFAAPVGHSRRMCLSIWKCNVVILLRILKKIKIIMDLCQARNCSIWNVELICGAHEVAGRARSMSWLCLRCPWRLYLLKTTENWKVFWKYNKMMIFP